MTENPVFDVQDMVDDLSPLALALLERLGPSDDYGYRNFKQLSAELGRGRSAIKAAVAELRKHDLVEFARGLMTEGGEVAGSGYARSDSGGRLIAIYEAVSQSVAIFSAPKPS